VLIHFTFVFPLRVQLARSCDVIFLAVKPLYIGEVLNEIKSTVSGNSGKLVVSIAAGITLSTMENISRNTPIIRVMPNTPCMVGETAAAMSMGRYANDSHRDVVLTLMSAVGICFEVPERLIGAVTGVAGSGVAYVFMFIEALADGGVRSGLPRDVAQQLAAQTLLGGAKMVLETGEHPGLLKDKVASPGGTTIAAIHALENGGLRSTVMNAVYAAFQKSEEMAKAAK